MLPATNDEIRDIAPEKVLALQAAMERLPPAQLLDIEAMTTHHFADGAYAREMRIPAGALVVGKLHKTAHVCVVSQGVVDVLDETGTVRRVIGPATFVSQPGTKRVAFAVTDTVWTVFHPTHERDLDRIEAQFIAKNFDELLASGALDNWAIATEGRECLGVQ